MSVLGTAAYMSPKQARGQPVDNRTDIWAFGDGPRYEMLSGRKKAFEGEKRSRTRLTAVLKTDPDWSPPAGGDATGPASCSAPVPREVRPRATFLHIGAARLELEEALAEARAPGPSASAVDRAHPSRRRVALAIALALALGIALGAAVVSVPRGRGEPARDGVARSPLRYTVSLAELRPRLYPDDGVVRVSPDGSLLAITAGVGPGKPRLSTAPEASSSSPWQERTAPRTRSSRPTGSGCSSDRPTATFCSARPSRRSGAPGARSVRGRCR